MVVGLIALNLVDHASRCPGIAWQDHVGGLIAGAALTAAYVYAPQSNRTLIQVAATVAMLALLVVGVVLRDLSQLAHSVVCRASLQLRCRIAAPDVAALSATSWRASRRTRSARIRPPGSTG